MGDAAEILRQAIIDSYHEHGGVPDEMLAAAIERQLEPYRQREEETFLPEPPTFETTVVGVQRVALDQIALTIGAHTFVIDPPSAYDLGSALVQMSGFNDPGE